MKKIFSTLIALLIIQLSIAQTDAYSIFSKSLRKISSAKSMRYFNVAKEKVNGKYNTDRSLVKLVRKPFKVYLFQEKEDGSEILYNSMINREKAIVNPGKFPYITLKLSPYGSIMRNNTHHTIFQADIKYTYDILHRAIKKGKLKDLLVLKGKVKVDDKVLYKIELSFKDYKKYQYEVEKGEDIASIAKKKDLGAYKILELNPNISFYDDVDAGDIITLPKYYSERLVLFIDTKNHLPYMVEIYDSKGLYESYKFEDLVLNYAFKKHEFSEDYEEYGF